MSPSEREYIVMVEGIDSGIGGNSLGVQWLRTLCSHC